MDIRKLEEKFGLLLKRFRETEIEPLRREINALRSALNNERRLSALEQRAGIEPAAEELDLPNWRSRQ